MVFDFQTISAFATKAYRELGENSYTLEEVLSVFRCYFEQYERYMGEPHPHIRLDQIKHIIHVMPYMDKEFASGADPDLEPDCYPILIDQHFQTAYKNCDYRINHFFSGAIRELRFYETCY